MGMVYNQHASEGYHELVGWERMPYFLNSMLSSGLVANKQNRETLFTVIVLSFLKLDHLLLFST